MHHALDPDTARLVAADRVAGLRRDRLDPLATLGSWRTGRHTPTERDCATQTASNACPAPTTRMHASVS